MDWSHDEIFVQHVRSGEHKWIHLNNGDWMIEKWGRQTGWTKPSFRQVGEADHHPEITREYEQRFNMKSRIDEINLSVNSGLPIFQ